MGISYVPGVGPQNSDVATAVAGVVPTLSQINTSVNTQTNNSAIASAVAGTVPTLSQINTAVANNASPFGGTWTNLGITSFSGTSTTISSLGSYKSIKILWNVTTNGTPQMALRVNGDSSGNYHWMGLISRSGSTIAFATQNQHSSQALFLMNNVAQPSNVSYGVIEIDNAQGGSYKIIKSRTSFFDGSNNLSLEQYCMYTVTSGISSLTLLDWQGNSLSGSIRIVGAS